VSDQSTSTPPSSSPSSSPAVPALLPRTTDPHASKIAPDDPRLRLPHAQGRTLRKGPAILLLGALLGVVLLAIAIALQPAPPPKTPTAASATAPVQPPIVPDVIRVGPTPTPSPVVTVKPRPLPHHAPVESGPSLRTGALANVRRFARQDQADKAAAAGILFEAKADPGGGGAPALPATGAQATPHAAATAQGAGTPGGTGGAQGQDEDPNRQNRKNAFLDAQGAAKTTDYLVSSLQHPRSPFELKAGSIIPAVLVTGINSDLPGPVIGQVRENVYDTVTGNYLLVPQGSRLLATYDSMVSWGQERVVVCWNRLIFPNGDSINLQCMPAGDLEGAAGLTDDVNEHWWRLLKGAAIATLLAATSEGLAGNVSGYNPTVPQMFAQGAGGQINQVGQQLTRRDLQVQPTITVRPGFSVNVLVTKDIVLPRYAAAQGALGRALPSSHLP
jgi:type IV secretory pathway VirB10-like protein